MDQNLYLPNKYIALTKARAQAGDLTTVLQLPKHLTATSLNSELLNGW